MSVFLQSKKQQRELINSPCVLKAGLQPSLISVLDFFMLELQVPTRTTSQQTNKKQRFPELKMHNSENWKWEKSDRFIFIPKIHTKDNSLHF